MPYMPIVRFVDEPWPAEDAWSVAIRMIEAPRNPDRWIADMVFRVEEAPHESLKEGREFELYEGGQCVARGNLIGDAAALVDSGRDAATA